MNKIGVISIIVFGVMLIYFIVDFTIDREFRKMYGRLKKIERRNTQIKRERQVFKDGSTIS